MRLKYKCKECGTSIGFEGLCWPYVQQNNTEKK